MNFLDMILDATTHNINFVLLQKSKQRGQEEGKHRKQ